MIVISPGHGGHDPGVVAPSGMTERQAALETALTLNWMLRRMEYRTELTRSTDVWVPFAERTRLRPDQQMLISIHYNSVGAHRLVFHQANGRSLCHARVLAAQAGTTRVWSSDMSRFGRLYIDDCRAPAVLWEVDPIDRYPLTPEAARNYRIVQAGYAALMVKAFFPAVVVQPPEAQNAANSDVGNR